MGGKFGGLNFTFPLAAKNFFMLATSVCQVYKIRLSKNEIIDFGASGSVILSPARFQRATARALTPNIKLVVISSTSRKSLPNPTVKLNRRKNLHYS